VVKLLLLDLVPRQNEVSLCTSWRRKGDWRCGSTRAHVNESFMCVSVSLMVLHKCVCVSVCFACFHKKLHNFRRFCSVLTSNNAFDAIRYRTVLLDPLTLFLGSGTRGGAGGLGTALQAGRARVRFSFVSLEFFVDVILPAALWPWCRLSL